MYAAGGKRNRRVRHRLYPQVSYNADVDSASGFAGSLASEIDSPANLCSTLESQSMAIMTEQCLGCHGNHGISSGNFRNATNLAMMLEDGVIVPGAAEASLLAKCMHPSFPTAMPPGVGSSPEDIATVEAWIEHCL